MTRLALDSIHILHTMINCANRVSQGSSLHQPKVLLKLRWCQAVLSGFKRFQAVLSGFKRCQAFQRRRNVGASCSNTVMPRPIDAQNSLFLPRTGAPSSTKQAQATPVVKGRDELHLAFIDSNPRPWHIFVLGSSSPHVDKFSNGALA